MEQFLLFIIIAIASLVLNRRKNANKQQADQRVEQGEPTVQQAPRHEGAATLGVQNIKKAGSCFIW